MDFIGSYQCLLARTTVVPSRPHRWYPTKSNDKASPWLRHTGIYYDRHTGRGVRGPVDSPTKIRADTTFIRAKDNTLVWLTVSPNGTGIRLPEIHFGWGNKGDAHRVLLYDRLLLFSPWRGRVKAICVRHSGNTRFDPQMDVGRTPLQMRCWVMYMFAHVVLACSVCLH